jgi:hypothetical protein
VLRRIVVVDRTPNNTPTARWHQEPYEVTFGLTRPDYGDVLELERVIRIGHPDMHNCVAGRLPGYDDLIFTQEIKGCIKLL